MHLLTFVTVTLSLFHFGVSQSCGNNTFKCANSTAYYICLDFGNGNLVVADPNLIEPCPQGSLCSDKSTLECDIPVPIVTTRKLPTTKLNQTRKAGNSTAKITTKIFPTTKLNITRKAINATVKITTRKLPTTKLNQTRKAVNSTVKITTKRPTTKKANSTISPSTLCGQNTKIVDPNSRDCKRYLICYRLPVIGFVTWPITCPTPSLFDPIKKVCSLTYKCSASNSTNTCPNTPQCVLGGKLADYTVSDCKGYVICIKSGSAFQPYKYKCPLNSVFNPNSKVCSTVYKCPPFDPAVCSTIQRPTTRIIADTPKMPTLPPIPTNPCITDGRLPDSSVSNCKGYILCIHNLLGILNPKPGVCPGASRFDPNIRACSMVYKCPSAINPVPFTCVTAGKFADVSVSGCKQYILCTRDINGKFIKNTYSCSGTSLFNPNTRGCIIPSLYKCPN